MDNKYDKEIKEQLNRFENYILKYNTINFFALTKAIIKIESNFNPDEIQVEKNVNDYSIGLMQVRIDTAQWINKLWSKSRDEIKKLLFDINFNLYTGIKYMFYQCERYKGNIKDILASYNAGSVKYNEYGEYINQKYVDKGLKYYFIYLQDDEKKK